MLRILIPQITWLLLICLMLTPSPLLAADATITVKKEQSGREVTLQVGNILRIELPGQSGTGYLWLVEAAGAPYLELISETTKTVGEPLAGGPVIKVWRFKAAQPGACQIKIAYYRPWEGVGKAVDHFRLQLLVK
jgi:predicted secreted protein